MKPTFDDLRPRILEKVNALGIKAEGETEFILVNGFAMISVQRDLGSEAKSMGDMPVVMLLGKKTKQLVQIPLYSLIPKSEVEAMHE